MIDLKTLTKAEILERAKWKCPVPGHSKHDGLAHPRCYEKLKAAYTGERIGFLDIESEDLKADYGIMFCWCVLDAQTNEIKKDIINADDIKKGSSKKRDVAPTEDKRIVQSLIDCMSNYDRVVAHYGSRFDLPFIRTRAVICGLDFPTYGLLNQTDTWIILKNKFKLSRNSLMNATLKLLGSTRKDFLSHSIKHGCLRGEEWALKDSLVHCENDVKDLRDLYNKIHGFMRKTNSSI